MKAETARNLQLRMHPSPNGVASALSFLISRCPALANHNSPRCDASQNFMTNWAKVTRLIWEFPEQPQFTNSARNTKVVKKTKSHLIGLKEVPGARSVQDLLSALSNEHYRKLIGFARVRLRKSTDSHCLQQCLAVVDAEDLVHQAILKLYLGDEDPSLGRHLQACHRTSMAGFLACVKGIIASDLNTLVCEAPNRYEHEFIGDPEQEPGAVEVSGKENVHDLASRRDLQRVLFKKLYSRIQNQPSLLAVVEDWERRFLDDERVGSEGADRNLVFRVRELAREIIADLAAEFSPSVEDGREMLL